MLKPWTLATGCCGCEMFTSFKERLDKLVEQKSVCSY